jgi:transcriptional regulator ATRX
LRALTHFSIICNHQYDTQALRPINNHPGCIIVKANEDLDRENSAKKKSANSEDKEEKDDDPDNRQFHDSIRENRGDEVLLNVDSGAKFVLLLHLLALAAQQNEKVLIFSNCLRTLSFIETVLGYPDWKEHVPSLASTFPDALGGWEKGKDFYRIDGGICGSDRGDIVKKFNSDGSRTLLLSMQAGGIGTNLVGLV